MLSKYKKLFSSVTSDLIYSIAGLCLMNGALQLLVNPLINSWIGEEKFGMYQSILAVVAIIGNTFGIAANYSRMVRHREKKDENSDYNIFLLIIAALCIPVSVIALVAYHVFTPASLLLLIPLMIFTVLRYYGDVWYRINLNYKGFFLYYLVITAGYCAGLLFCKATMRWEPAILLGEAAAFVFVFFTGKIYRGSNLKKSENFSGSIKSISLLSGNNLISALAQNTDRIILQISAGGTAVTTFYVATLLGKIVSLFTTPLNGVLIGYLTKYDGKITKKMFLVFVAALLAIGCIAVIGCYIGSVIFVKIFYADVFNSAKPYFLLANAGQVFYFLSNCLSTAILRIANEKYQVYLNLIYAVLFAATVIPMTLSMGLQGLTYSLLIANAGKFVIATFIGLHKSQSSAE